MTSSGAASWRASHSPDAAEVAAAFVRMIESARDSTAAAKLLHDTALADQADEHLHTVVIAARDAGVLWGDIGRALGVARGNAYQRYRRRPPEAARTDAPPL